MILKVDTDLILNGWEVYKESAVKSRNKYNGLLRSVLRNYGVQHEAEAFSGAFTNLHSRFKERKDHHDTKKVITGCIKKLSESMLKEFHQEFCESGDEGILFQRSPSIEHSMLQKASAWYIVTYSEPNARFLSFPWTVSKYLVHIKVRKTLSNPPRFSPAIVCLDEKICECDSRDLLPTYVETNVWNGYRFVCDRSVLGRALRTLILWAQDEDIVETPDRNQGLMYIETFIKLFLHVAELQGYVKSRNNLTANDVKTYSPGHLCLEFFKFCSFFRFYNQHEIKDILPFSLYKYSRLSKRAVISYHRFALSGKLQNLYFDEKIHKELIQMKPIYIDSKIFLNAPVDAASLKRAEEALIKYSKVDELTMRELLLTKKVCVSARGCENALKDLKSILRKNLIVLMQLFETGVMPEA